MNHDHKAPFHIDMTVYGWWLLCIRRTELFKLSNGSTWVCWQLRVGPLTFGLDYRFKGIHNEK